MVTIQQIADKAGVSRRTVDRVLNNRGTVKSETRDRIMQIVEELDYHPNPVGQMLVARKKNFHLAFCTKKSENSVIHKEILSGVIEKQKELEHLGVTIDIYYNDWDTPPSSQELNSLIDNFSADGLAIIPENNPMNNLLISKAQELGIPVVFYSADNPQFNRLCYVGCNYFKSGVIAAGLVGMCAVSKMKIAIFSMGIASEAADYPSYHDRVAGFENECNKHFPNIEIVGHYFLGKDVFDLYDVTKNVFNEHPDIELIYLVNPGDYSVCSAIKKVFKNKAIRVITNDLTEESRKYMKQNLITATISQDLPSQGSTALQLLFDYLVLGQTPADTTLYTDLTIFLPQSI